MLLPDDLWRVALCWLSHEDIMSMSITSKSFRRMLQLPPFHRAWQTMVIDSSRAKWVHALTRSSSTEPGTASVPRILVGHAGAKLHVLRLGHRLYPCATPCFGNAQLGVIADACPLLNTLRIYYRTVKFTLAGVKHLMNRCLLLKDVAMPFGCTKLRNQVFQSHVFPADKTITVSPSWVTSLRLHNVESCYVKRGTGAGYVPQLFANSLTSLRLVNVKNLLNLDFITALPLLRHLTVKHCRRPVGPISSDYVHTPSQWIYDVSPRLQSLTLVDADHVVCEQMVFRFIFGNIDSRAFSALQYLAVDGDILLTMVMGHLSVNFAQLTCADACKQEQHTFKTWVKYVRCSRCCAASPAKLRGLQTIYLYNKDYYALHDSL